ncbi:MAG: 2-oxoacid:acceptor oxidoreductase family protein [Dehalococcoidia bacterium]|nr:2-oxoacid:acceptor oxidoreductase family protein [Dehalococcoidia bacterium]
MHEEILIAGFGGQGVILAGKLLCQAAIVDGKQVVCSVSYGPEMRGGTANSGVIISDHPIGALMVSRPTIAILMNEPSMVKFEPLVRGGGLLLVNQSLVSSRSQRKDIRTLYVPAADLAVQLGNKDVANVVIIGALLGLKPVVTIAAVRDALKKALSRKHPEALAVDEKALQAGLDYVDTAPNGFS